jgi:hypothetical protein
LNLSCISSLSCSAIRTVVAGLVRTNYTFALLSPGDDGPEPRCGGKRTDNAHTHYLDHPDQCPLPARTPPQHPYDVTIRQSHFCPVCPWEPTLQRGAYR